MMAASPANATNQMDLDSAFVAAFGGPPPITRDVMQPSYIIGKRNRVPTSIPRTLSLAPERLVPLGGARFALIAVEMDENAAHMSPGAIGIAYLRADGQGWRLEHVWPELAFTGNSGKPSYEADVKRFGSRIIYLATSKYCGMGSCADSIAVVSLDQETPRFLGFISGDSVFPTFPDPVTSCETYKYSVEIKPPRTQQGLLSVTYRGWTAPNGKTAPKHVFRVQAEAIVLGDHLELRPKLNLPDCGS